MEPLTPETELYQGDILQFEYGPYGLVTAMVCQVDDGIFHLISINHEHCAGGGRLGNRWLEGTRFSNGMVKGKYYLDGLFPKMKNPVVIRGARIEFREEPNEVSFWGPYRSIIRDHTGREIATK